MSNFPRLIPAFTAHVCKWRFLRTHESQTFQVYKFSDPWNHRSWSTQHLVWALSPAETHSPSSHLRWTREASSLNQVALPDPNLLSYNAAIHSESPLTSYLEFRLSYPAWCCFPSWFRFHSWRPKWKTDSSWCELLPKRQKRCRCRFQVYWYHQRHWRCGCCTR